jgi:valyl-tRNA synthetase
MNSDRMQKIQEKSWNPKFEHDISKIWEEGRLYKFIIDRTKSLFVIDTPPPYPSGRPWHIGAAAHYAQIDMIARVSRMQGNSVHFPIGIDRNGLPVEIYTEKKYGVRMRNMEREQFLNLCRSALDDLEKEMILIMKSLGLSGDFEGYYRTDSDQFRALTQNTFITLWKRGLVYSSTRPNNYCTDCGTTIADAEIIYEERKTKLTYMKFKTKGSSGQVIVASTRPELLSACQCVIVNPNDPRYKDLDGLILKLPLYDREIKLIKHHLAKPEFGTGAVMVCSYGDKNDVQLFRELKLKEIVVISENGRLTKNAGKYANLNVNLAREKIIEDLRESGFLEKEEDIMHRTPICERSKTPVEIIPMQDYYLKQIEFVPTLREFANRINFHPAIHRQILLDWLDAVAIDWPISRRRFYGTEIPIWYCKNCRTPNLPEPGKYYKPWKEEPPFSHCYKCHSSTFVGEDRTFDTWMDSSITPLFITRYGKDHQFHEHAYPTKIRPQAKDIVRTWLFYTMLRCYQLTGEMPWSDAWIMGYGVDERGKKMSKSKGNTVDPFPIIGKYGADAFRFWSASEANLGQDFRCSEQKIEESQKFLTKLWNIGRFVSSFDVITTPPNNLVSTDKWIIAELGNLVAGCKRGYRDLNFFMPASLIREFTWNLFASHYLELIKSRAYNKGEEVEYESALYTLHKCFSTILILLSPICPFITEKLWTELYSANSIHLQPLPQGDNPYGEMRQYSERIVEFNSRVWNKKREIISNDTGKPLSLKDPIHMNIPTDLKIFENDLTQMHNLQPEMSS